jgi:hypothetical protein
VTATTPGEPLIGLWYLGAVTASLAENVAPRTSLVQTSALRRFVAFSIVLATVGIGARLVTFLDRDGRLLRQFPTEDGYLMLTIARNLALGKGMSTADGYIPTNGTQPLFNFVETIGFVLAGGDKKFGVAWTLGCHVVIACLAAYGIFLLIRQTLRTRPKIAERAAWLGAALWLASPVALPHTMNCLETGLYAALVVYCLVAWQRLWIRRGERPAFRLACGVGFSLGVAFWARIDAIFVIFAVTAGHLWMGWRRDGLGALKARLVESLVMGSVSVVVASPWLISNELRFGSVMPISGVAQSHGSSFGSNLSEVPSKLLEYGSVIVQLPQSLEKTPALLVPLALYGLGVVWLLRKANPEERVSLLVFGGLSALYVCYYGLLFGAPHFVGRYLFPLSIFGVMIAAVVAVLAYDACTEAVRWLPVAIAGGALVFVCGLHVRAYVKGKNHQHFQVVDYVQEHIADAEWVGAVQTGTLGFFHDRTVNLDGKVNPAALQMLLRRRTPQYVVEGRFGPEQAPIEWLVDWVGISAFMREEPIPSHFDLVLASPEANLAVLHRH